RCGVLLPANSRKAQVHMPSPSPRGRLRRPRQWRHRRRNSSPQPLGVKCEMVPDKALDEIIGVVIPLLLSQRELLLREPARFLEKLGLELIFKEIIGKPLIDQNVIKMTESTAARHQGGSIMRRPGRTVGAQIGGKSLLTPGAARRRNDGRKGRDGTKMFRIFQRQCQCPMPAH